MIEIKKTEIHNDQPWTFVWKITPEQLLQWAKIRDLILTLG